MYSKYNDVDIKYFQVNIVFTKSFFYLHLNIFFDIRFFIFYVCRFSNFLDLNLIFSIFRSFFHIQTWAGGGASTERGGASQAQTREGHFLTCRPLFQQTEGSMKVDLEASPPGGPEPLAIQCRDVCRSYGKLKVLSNLNLTVPQGHMWAHRLKHLDRSWFGLVIKAGLGF